MVAAARIYDGHLAAVQPRQRDVEEDKVHRLLHGQPRPLLPVIRAEDPVAVGVQTALQEQGYYNDAVDGLIGPRTRAALSAFQRDRGLPITAAIDGPTLQALGLY